VHHIIIKNEKENKFFYNDSHIQQQPKLKKMMSAITSSIQSHRIRGTAANLYFCSPTTPSFTAVTRT